MALNVGTTAITKVYVGTTEITKGYVGTIEVWSSWSPLSITGCVLWLDASDASTITASGSPARVSQWNNKAGSNHAVQATGARQPTTGATTQNGLNVLGFSANEMQVASVAVGAFTIFTVAKMTGTAGLVYEHGANLNSNPGRFLYGTVGATVAYASTGNINSRSNKDLSSNWGIGTVARVLCHTGDGTHAGHLLYINGTQASLVNYTASSNPGTTVITATLNIGARAGQIIPITGFIGEMVVYNSALSSTDRGTVTDYLTAKWGT